MNSIRTVALALVLASMVFTGCETTPSKSAKIPPSEGSELPTTSDGATANDSDTPVAPAPPTESGGSGSIPIKDLPTKTVRGAAYPYAIKTKWPGLVKSPYAQDKQLVDVSANPTGTLMKCPFTGKIFVVP